MSHIVRTLFRKRFSGSRDIALTRRKTEIGTSVLYREIPESFVGWARNKMHPSCLCQRHPVCFQEMFTTQSSRLVVFNHFSFTFQIRHLLNIFRNVQSMLSFKVPKILNINFMSYKNKNNTLLFFDDYLKSFFYEFLKPVAKYSCLIHACTISWCFSPFVPQVERIWLFFCTIIPRWIWREMALCTRVRHTSYYMTFASKAGLLVALYLN